MNAIRTRRFVLCVATCVAVWLVFGGRAEAQFGALASPGKLSAAHANLEGLSNCMKCHEPGQKMATRKCLACHEPVAQRIARNVGVHRNKGGNCVTCHAEHAGTEAQMRGFDEKGFDHAANTSFPLEGKHQRLAVQCSACHKVRSFLTLSTTCASCHTDVHKASLGSNCQSCHSTNAAFKESGGRFDHTKAAFQLVGAHKTVTCARCHVNGVFKGVKFGFCTDCHKVLHPPTFGTTCTSCHTKDSWRTTTVNHAKTTFPLKGKHERLECAACHKQPATKVKLTATTCAACHADVHRGTFKQDCKACHSESGFGGAPFDHATKTKFALVGKHDGLVCVKCHTDAKPASRPMAPVRVVASMRLAPSTTVNFTGLKTACVSCHNDVHKTELGTSCEPCHSPAGFKIPAYTHQGPQAFFGAQHAPATCEKCHATAFAAPAGSAAPVVRVGFKNTSTACASCHKDPHLGQEGTECQTCHSLQNAKFAVASFSHTTTRFALVGRHESLTCAQCHKSESGVFPAGTGTAVRFRGLGTECRTCHEDVHLGQNSDRCETCHATVTFKIPTYNHKTPSVSAFFTGKHATASCPDCHKSVTGKFPSATGTAIRFRMKAECVTCHTDIHRGALGPNCDMCHRP